MAIRVRTVIRCLSPRNRHVFLSKFYTVYVIYSKYSKLKNLWSGESNVSVKNTNNQLMGYWPTHHQGYGNYFLRYKHMYKFIAASHIAGMRKIIRQP
jgi:hypothetical protein